MIALYIRNVMLMKRYIFFIYCNTKLPIFLCFMWFTIFPVGKALVDQFGKFSF